jgi:hypothetical protein
MRQIGRWSNYQINDYVSNLMRAVLNFQMQVVTVVSAEEYYKIPTVTERTKNYKHS